MDILDVMHTQQWVWLQEFMVSEVLCPSSGGSVISFKLAPVWSASTKLRGVL